MTELSMETIFSGTSLAVTLYFWFVQARRERPSLMIHQVGDIRAMCRRHPQRDDAQRLCLTQTDTHGVLIANNSSRQNSIVLYDCWLVTAKGGKIRGDWGFVGDDRPPWNIGPDSTIAMGLACFFDVAPEYEIPDDLQVRVEFITANGQRFAHTFHRQCQVQTGGSATRPLAA